MDTPFSPYTIISVSHICHINISSLSVWRYETSVQSMSPDFKAAIFFPRASRVCVLACKSTGESPGENNFCACSPATMTLRVSSAPWLPSLTVSTSKYWYSKLLLLQSRFEHFPPVSSISRKSHLHFLLWMRHRRACMRAYVCACFLNICLFVSAFGGGTGVEGTHSCKAHKIISNSIFKKRHSTQRCSTQKCI